MAWFMGRAVAIPTRPAETSLGRSSIRARNVAVRKQACSVSHMSASLLSCTSQSVRRRDVLPMWHRWSRALRQLRPLHPWSESSYGYAPPLTHLVAKASLSTIARGKGTGGRRKRKTFIPIKAAVELSARARTFFSRLLASPPRSDVIGIRLNYQQSHTGEPRMVFTFDFVTKEDLDADDEPVSLDVVPEVDKSDGQTRYVPKPPRDSWDDGRPKLYVSTNAFFKVLGATVDVDPETMAPLLHDAEGNRIDPNA